MGSSYEQENGSVSRYQPFGGTGTYNPIGYTSTLRTDSSRNDEEFQNELEEMQQSFDKGRRWTNQITIKRNLSSSSSQSDTSGGSDNDNYEDAEDIVEENEKPIPPANLRSVNYRINYGKPLQAMQEAIRNNIERPSSQRQPGQNNSNPSRQT